MIAAPYERVRFLGYAIPTSPADIVTVGYSGGPGAMAGSYRGLHDPDADIRGRCRVLTTAVDLARAQLHDLGDPSVLNVFVAPESFWHGPAGPYLTAPGDPDPVQTIAALLREQFDPADYPHFLMVMGSALTAEVADIDAVLSSPEARTRNDLVRRLAEAWRATSGSMREAYFGAMVGLIRSAHAAPLVQVRNRALVLGTTPLDGVLEPWHATVASVEKYFDSNEDFVLWDVADRAVVTEALASYPALDLSGGDLKRAPFDPYAVFALPAAGDPLYTAVEVCLDHTDRRLRRSDARSPWPGARGRIDLHLVPSCGAQLHASAVAAGAGGWAFNCDGQYPLGDLGVSDLRRQGVVGGVPCVYADHLDEAAPGHAAHTQLARVRTAPQGGDPHAPGAQDATFTAPDEVTLDTVPVPAIDGIAEMFAGGPGALHLYGLGEPLPLRR